MLTGLPLTDSFALAWEYDEAFDRSRETFAADFERAVETLDFDPLCLPGQKPTLFVFRPIVGMPGRRLLDAEAGFMERTALAFRMALVRIENGDKIPAVNRVLDPAFGALGPMAQSDLMDFLDGFPLLRGAPFAHLVTSLGGMALARSMKQSPRS